MRNDQKGFTIVELLLAMAVFSLVLVVIVVAFTQILQTYRAGVISQKTQEANREILSKITRDAHSSNKIEVVDDSLCFNEKQYRFIGSNIKYSDNASECGQAAPGEQDLVSDNLKVQIFEPSVATSSSGVVLGADLRLVTSTNDTDDLIDNTTDPSNPVCDPSQKGSQYCSTTETVTSVGLRGRAQ